MKTATGTHPITVVIRALQCLTGDMSLVYVLASKAITRRTGRRDNAHHSQQSAKQEHCDSASDLKETEHWQVQHRTFECRRARRQIGSINYSWIVGKQEVERSFPTTLSLDRNSKNGVSSTTGPWTAPRVGYWP